MIGVLDEAANVCRWRELPNLYSHYGSRGIVLMTILQSWSQGVEVWGRDGMRKLWSAANIKVYGGGVAEAEFLNELAQLVGSTGTPTPPKAVPSRVRPTATTTTARNGLWTFRTLPRSPVGGQSCLPPVRRPRCWKRCRG